MSVFLSRILLVAFIGSISAAGVFADEYSEARKRVAEINKAQKESTGKISHWRSNAVSNAQLIERELAKLQKLESEKNALMPTIQRGRMDGLQKKRQKLMRGVEGDMKRALANLRFMAEAGASGGKHLSERQKLKKLQEGYLTLVMDYMLSDANTTQVARIAEVSNQARRELVTAEKSALDNVNGVIDSESDYVVTETKAHAEAHYRFIRLRIEAAEVARMMQELGADEALKKRLEQLTTEIVGNDPNNFVAPRDSRQKATHKWFRQMKREIDLEEFRRMAANGPVFDDKKLVTGKTRQEIAYFSELALADRVKRSASTMPISKIFWPTDSRIGLAKEIEAQARANPDHMMFAYLQTGVEPSPRMYMMTVMRTLRHEQEKINTWLVEAYNKPWYDTGLGALLRASDAGGTGDAGFTAVKKRIDKYMKEVDGVHDVFKRAIETADPENLAQADQDLLAAFGYIKKQIDGSLSYEIPKKTNIRGLTESAQRGVKLPGAPLLDVITPKTVAVTAVSTLVPGYAATMVEGMALRAGLSMRTIFAAKMATEVGAGAAFDALNQLMDKGEVNKGELLIESVLLGGLLEKFNKLSMGAGDEVAQKLVHYKNTSALRDVLKDEKVRDIAANWVSDSLGLASETAITLFYESQYKGTEIDFNTFISNVVNSTMTRTISSTHGAIVDGKFLPQKDYVSRLPEWIQPYVKSDQRLAKELYHLSRKQSKMQQEAMGRYHDAVGRGEPSADKLFSALLKGEISWMDLTIAYQGDTAGMDSLMHGVKDLRDSFFEDVKHDALRLALKELKDEWGRKIASIDENASAAEREILLKQVTDEYLHDYRYMAEEIISPGSDSPVSDIDRSMQHPRLRKLMEHMFEVRARELSDGAYIPTSARAFDVNEYYNVMPFISFTNTLRAQLDPIVLGNGLTHGKVMDSFGFAAAMMHMNHPQRVYFKLSEQKRWETALVEKGTVKDSPDYHKGMAEFELLMNMAKDDLARGRRELHSKMEELGLPARDPESEVRARSALYQERIEVYYKKLKELDLYDGSNASKMKKHAEVEREMAYMLREGIETYSGSATLDIIVSQMQIAKLKMGPAMTDANFTLEGTLRNLKPEHIDFMVRDQCLMMVEHINAYYHGHELPYNSGKALAKYAQRALLAMKIKGDLDINALIASGDMSHPALRLFTMTNRLMKQKPNPEGFNEVLSSLTPEGNPDAGLKELMMVIEQVVPGMERQSLQDNFLRLSEIQAGRSAPNPFKTRPFFQAHRYLNQRNNIILEKQIEEYGGGALLEKFYLARLVENRKFLEEIMERLRELEDIDRNYERKDWPEIVRLKRAIHGLRLVARVVPGQPAPEWGKRIVKPMQKMQKRLQELRLPQGSTLSTSGYSNYGRLWLQMNHLNLTIEIYEKSLQRARELKAKEAKYIGMDLSGTWTFRRGTHRGKAKIQHVGENLKIWLSSDVMTAKPPHFIMTGKFKRGKIRGAWTELHSPELKFQSRNRAPAKAWKNQGIYNAVVGVDRSFITIGEKATEVPKHKEDGWRWAGLSLIPAGEGVVAPTDLQMLTVSSRVLQQATRAEDSDDKPRKGKGHLMVKRSTAEGKDAHTRYDLYSRGSYDTAEEDHVASGMTSRMLEVAPGEYDMVAEVAGKIISRSVEIRDGATMTISLSDLGQLRFKMINYLGKEFYSDLIQLRVLKDGKPVAWSGSGATGLSEGSYDVVVYYDRGPVSKSADYRKSVQIKPKTETVVEARFGAVQLDVIGSNGQKFTDRSWVDCRFINADKSFGQRNQASANEPIDLMPGKYEVSFSMESGQVMRQSIVVRPAEITKRSLRLGSLNVKINGRPATDNGEYRLMLTSRKSSDGLIALSKMQNIEMVPGEYSAQLFSKKSGMSEKRSVTVKSGNISTVSFKIEEE